MVGVRLISIILQRLSDYGIKYRSPGGAVREAPKETKRASIVGTRSRAEPLITKAVHLSQEPAGNGIKRVDTAIAEIADPHGAPELAEASRRQRHAPG